MNDSTTASTLPAFAAEDLVQLLEERLGGISGSVMTFPERHPDGTRDYARFKYVEVVVAPVDESTLTELAFDVYFDEPGVALPGDREPGLAPARRLARFQLAVEQIEVTA